MKLRTRSAAIVLAATAVMALVWGVGTAAAATRVSEDDLRFALIQMDAGQPEHGQTVDQFIQCLQIWNPGDRKERNVVKIARLGADLFTVSAVLRSRSIFHFQVAREHGYAVALLRRVEYQVTSRGGYQQITDAETKRVLLSAACTKP